MPALWNDNVMSKSIWVPDTINEAVDVKVCLDSESLNSAVQTGCISITLLIQLGGECKTQTSTYTTGNSLRGRNWHHSNLKGCQCSIWMPVRNRTQKRCEVHLIMRFGSYDYSDNFQALRFYYAQIACALRVSPVCARPCQRGPRSTGVSSKLLLTFSNCWEIDCVSTSSWGAESESRSPSAAAKTYSSIAHYISFGGQPRHSGTIGSFNIWFCTIRLEREYRDPHPFHLIYWQNFTLVWRQPGVNSDDII